MHLVKQFTLAAAGMLLTGAVWAASPNIRVPGDQGTRYSDCSIWLCLPQGFSDSNGGCSMYNSMGAFSARQVRVVHKRIYTDLPLARYCTYPFFAGNGPVKNVPVPEHRSLLDNLMPWNWIGTAVADETETPQLPADIDEEPRIYGEFGDSAESGPDHGNSFQVRPKAVIDEQLVCVPGMVRTWSSCNGSGSNCTTHRQCLQTMVVPHEEFWDQYCDKLDDPVYDDYGILIESNAVTSDGRKPYCNRTRHQTSVWTQGVLQGEPWEYDGDVLYTITPVWN